jgi:hypothetical protein
VFLLIQRRASVFDSSKGSHLGRRSGRIRRRGF